MPLLNLATFFPVGEFVLDLARQQGGTVPPDAVLLLGHCVAKTYLAEQARALEHGLAKADDAVRVFEHNTTLLGTMMGVPVAVRANLPCDYGMFVRRRALSDPTAADLEVARALHLCLHLGEDRVRA